MKPCGRGKKIKKPTSRTIAVPPPSSDQRACLFALQVFLPSSKETAGRMTAVENKEEISDTDSGIILHCGENFAVITL